MKLPYIQAELRCEDRIRVTWLVGKNFHVGDTVVLRYDDVPGRRWLVTEIYGANQHVIHRDWRVGGLS
jgi:hypothetical protein